MLYREIILVDSQLHGSQNALGVQKVEFLNVKPCVT